MGTRQLVCFTRIAFPKNNECACSYTDEKMAAGELTELDLQHFLPNREEIAH